MTERDAYIALNMMDKIGPVGVRSLVSVLGSASAIFSATAAELQQADGIGPLLAEQILRRRDDLDVETEMRRAGETATRLVTPLDDEYPAALKTIHDPPLALYVRGQVKPSDRHGIAVVGTRHPTHYGMDCARNLSYQLGKAGVCVVSGLALGVDTAAHEGALRSGGRTLAVIGSGFDHLYPDENVRLAERIAEQGAVMSEFPFARKPDKATFPMRNRIVSGISRGVLVIEAGLRSGAMITASQAMEQGRSVFAVPGRIDSYASAGTNALLKDGAGLVTGVSDILEHFEMLFPLSARPVADPSVSGGDRGLRVAMDRPDLGGDEKRVITLLEGGEMGVDVLIRESGIRPAVMASLLVGLELKKVVRMLPGRQVTLIR
jgi:DNA processing protein